YIQPFVQSPTSHCVLCGSVLYCSISTAGLLHCCTLCNVLGILLASVSPTFTIALCRARPYVVVAELRTIPPLYSHIARLLKATNRNLGGSDSP
ncbi:hypothetical protein J6590_043752, partial [Homalodisca vitripennis]